jgi:hypothetical protein
MARMLSKLAQLTSLSVKDSSYGWRWMDGMNICLDAACNMPLQRFAFEMHNPAERKGRHLSPGPLQRTLQQLYVPVDLIPSSMKFLRGAKSLNDIVIYGISCPELARQLSPFWRWAAQHRPLRSLTLSTSERNEDSEQHYLMEHCDDAEAILLESVVHLKQRRPNLYIDHSYNSFPLAANAYFYNLPTR